MQTCPWDSIISLHFQYLFNPQQRYYCMCTKQICTKSIVPWTTLNLSLSKLIVSSFEVISHSQRRWFCSGEHSSHKLFLWYSRKLKYPTVTFKFHRFFFYTFVIPDIYIWDLRTLWQNNANLWNLSTYSVLPESDAQETFPILGSWWKIDVTRKQK